MVRVGLEARMRVRIKARVGNALEMRGKTKVIMMRKA